MNMDVFLDMWIKAINDDIYGQEFLDRVTDEFDEVQREASSGPVRNAKGILVQEVKAYLTWGKLKSKLNYYNEEWGLDLPKMTISEHSAAEEASRLKMTFQKKLKTAGKNAKARAS